MWNCACSRALYHQKVTTVSGFLALKTLDFGVRILTIFLPICTPPQRQRNFRCRFFLLRPRMSSSNLQEDLRCFLAQVRSKTSAVFPTPLPSTDVQNILGLSASEHPTPPHPMPDLASHAWRKCKWTLTSYPTPTPPHPWRTIRCMTQVQVNVPIPPRPQPMPDVASRAWRKWKWTLTSHPHPTPSLA